MSWITLLVFIVMVIYYYTYCSLNRVYDYWKKRGVIGPTPSFLFGNTIKLIKREKSFNQILTQYYFEFSKEKLVGIFEGRKPIIMIQDIELIKAVLVKDFSFFRNRAPSIIDSPVGENLFHAQGERWRLIRQKLTPIFSSGKLRNMFPLIQKCVQQFHRYLENLLEHNSEPEMRHLMEKFTLELFSSCVLGIDVSTLSDRENYCHKIAKKIFDIGSKTTLAQGLDSIFPGVVRYLKLKLYNSEVSDFFLNLVKDVVEERAGKPKLRKDFMDLLIELREQGNVTADSLDAEEKVNITITHELIAAQVLVFYAAGFNGSAATTSFSLYELALNQDSQEKLYQEISDVVDKYDGILTYDALLDMKYLDMVLAETMRKYPLGGVITREAGAAYTFSGTNVTIDKGINVVIPINAIHMDPNYFSNPEKFDPERFSPENIKSVKMSMYLPFGDGPRNCIGMRFAKMQSMIGMASILLKYKVAPCTRTVKKMRFNPKVGTMESVDGIYLKMLRRE